METKKWVKENVVCLPKSMDELTTILEVHCSDNTLSHDKVMEVLKKVEDNAIAGNEDVTINEVFNMQATAICNLSVPKKGDNRDTLSKDKVMEVLKKAATLVEPLELTANKICSLSVVGVSEGEITDFRIMLLNDNSWLNVSTMDHTIRKTIEWLQSLQPKG